MPSTIHGRGPGVLALLFASPRMMFAACALLFASAALHKPTRSALATCAVVGLDRLITLLLNTRDALARQANPSAQGQRLRELYSDPSERVLRKVLPALDGHCRAFVSLSPFVVVASSGARYGRGGMGLDCSPKGGEGGFVHVSDDGRTLAIPDVSGNNRLDTLTSLSSCTPGCDAMGLLFLVPGICEVLRVNGRAHVSEEPQLLETLSVSLPGSGKRVTPKVAIVVQVHEAYLHCGKAITRSKLWSDEARRGRDEFPSLAKCVCDQLARSGAVLAPGAAIVDGRLDVKLYQKFCADQLEAIAAGRAE